MILFNKLYYIDKYGHKQIQKQMRPIYQSAKQSLYGNKKNEIMRVAQENLYMLKRLSERTSFYNVEKWNKDYEASQYYKKNHCLHPPINFNQTQKYGNNKWGIIRKKFYSKTHYASMGDLGMPSKRIKISLKKKKKFEDYNYRDLNLVENKKTDVKNKNGYQFKKLSEIESVEKEDKMDNNNNNDKNKIINGKIEEKQEKIDDILEKEEKISNGDNEKGNEGIREPQKNMRDKKEEKGMEKTQNNESNEEKK